MFSVYYFACFGMLSLSLKMLFFPDILRYIERLVGQNKTQKVILEYLERDFNVKGGRLIIYAVAIRTSPVRRLVFAIRTGVKKILVEFLWKNYLLSIKNKIPLFR